MLQTSTLRWDGASLGVVALLVGAACLGPARTGHRRTHVDVEHVEDVNVDVAEVPRLLVDSGAAEDPFELDVLDFRVGFPDDSSTQL